ncbi:MAG: phosphatidylglycerol lysyltransferase domain-containing protein [Candidatus Andersenbacteria bacterium]
MRLAPAESVQSLDASKYYIAPDENNFDYLLSTEELSSFKGNKWRAKSNFVNRFKKMYRSKVIELDLGDPSTEKKIKGLFGLWAQKKAPNSKDTKNEGIAISRLLQFSKHFKTESIGLEIEGELVGFSINEITSPSSALLHFEKANLNFVGVYAYLMQQTAVHLRNKGCTILNYEQDLGLQGLKKAKASYFPVSFLKKYVVSK